MQLADLIEHPPLRLALVSGTGGLERPVRGAHAIDYPQPAPWIGAGYVVLTTGVGVRGSPGRQRSFVHGVADGEATALGFGIEVVFKSIPRPMLQAAEERSLPVFIVPYEVPFRDIVRHVTAATLQDQAGQLTRVIAMQDDLLAALERSDGAAALVERLGVLLDARVALFAADGRVLALAGHPPLKELWSLATSGTRAAPMRPRGYVLIREVEDGGYLAVTLRSAARAEAVARPAVAFAARALQTLAAARRAAAEGDHLIRAALLRDLVAATHLDRELLTRLYALGFEPGQSLQVLVAEAADNAATVAAIDSVLSTPTRLVGTIGTEVVVVWQGETVAEQALLAVMARYGATGGLAGPAADAVALPHSLTEARVALQLARHGSVALVSYASLGLADSLVALLPRERTPRENDLLAPLRAERPEMLQTLRSFFEHELDIMACARTLYLHPNSLRYRLAKIETVLGRSLRSPQTIADLYIALRAEALQNQPDVPT